MGAGAGEPITVMVMVMVMVPGCMEGRVLDLGCEFRSEVLADK
jgi:hypothetical protein